MTEPDWRARERIRQEEVRRRVAERSAILRPAILEQAAGDFYDFTTGAGRVIRAPRLPLLHWALTIHGQHLLSKWKPISPIGFKMLNDDPFHTDWMIGADIDILTWYGARDAGVEQDRDLLQAAHDLQWELQIEWMNFDAAVLSGQGRVMGWVIHPEPNQGLNLQPERNSHHKDVRVIVIPHAGPEYVQAAMQIAELGGAVITEQGGAMAHLVNIGREKNLRIVRVKDAMKRYPAHLKKVTVDCDRGKVELHVL